jgi:hypothetical protein
MPASAKTSPRAALELPISGNVFARGRRNGTTPKLCCGPTCVLAYLLEIYRSRCLDLALYVGHLLASHSTDPSGQCLVTSGYALTLD